MSSPVLHIILRLLILGGAPPVSSAPPSVEFPLELVGTWKQPSKNKEGVMMVHVSDHSDSEFNGVIEIRGLRDCPQPILFHGMIKAEHASISSIARIVCGHSGVLTAEVTKEKDGVFTGSFAYKYSVFSIPFSLASGTFLLHPASP